MKGKSFTERPMAKKARVFLDSNVILSGLISDEGTPRIILDIMCLNLPFLIGITGRYNIIEIERNLAKKLPGLLPICKEYLPKIVLEIIPIPSSEDVRRYYSSISDKDLPVLVSAIKGRADFLVTGDKKDFSRLKIKADYPFKILSPAEFIDIALPKILKEFSE